MKILALHLPQFHTIPENDKWWGKGFTEWANVRKAKPLFSGHSQPMVPLGNYYYDLSKKEDVHWQTTLANRYGLFGFVYYHYWFNGKKLLQKPCEILLSSKEIDINYCFCWANLSWSRTWENKKDILLQQSYGDEYDWKLHLEYLIPFFQDKRYIKKDGKPLFFIYSARDIPRYEEMVNYWNNELKKSGFNGIYMIEFISPANPSLVSDLSQAVMEFEPLFTARYGISPLMLVKRVAWKLFRKREYLDYDTIWQNILHRKRLYRDKEIIPGAFCAWDNTPRKVNNGLVIRNSSPKKFHKYFQLLCDQYRINKSSEYVVINAWNEWCEGAILEPTELFGYAFLEGVKSVSETFKH